MLCQFIAANTDLQISKENMISLSGKTDLVVSLMTYRKLGKNRALQDVEPIVASALDDFFSEELHLNSFDPTAANRATVDVDTANAAAHQQLLGVTDCGGGRGRRRSTYFSHAAPPTAATPALQPPLRPLPPLPPPNEGGKKSQTMFLDKTHKAALGAAAKVAEVAKEGGGGDGRHPLAPPSSLRDWPVRVRVRLPSRPAPSSAMATLARAPAPATQCNAILFATGRGGRHEATHLASLLRQAAPLLFPSISILPYPRLHPRSRLPWQPPFPTCLPVCLSLRSVWSPLARLVQVRLHSALSLERNCAHGIMDYGDDDETTLPGLNGGCSLLRVRAVKRGPARLS